MWRKVDNDELLFVLNRCVEQFLFPLEATVG